MCSVCGLLHRKGNVRYPVCEDKFTDRCALWLWYTLQKAHNTTQFNVSLVWTHSGQRLFLQAEVPVAHAPLTLQCNIWKPYQHIPQMLAWQTWPIFSHNRKIIMYNLINTSNLVRNCWIYLFISLLYTFRASMCPSSGENCCIYVSLVFVTLKGGSFKLQQVSPDDGNVDARNM
jgi:hypothetical protein